MVWFDAFPQSDGAVSSRNPGYAPPRHLRFYDRHLCLLARAVAGAVTGLGVLLLIFEAITVRRIHRSCGQLR